MPRRVPTCPPTCEDSLRALGRYLDFTGLAEISLVVRDGDCALIARRGRDARQYPVRVRFTAREILALRNVTASQRGRGRPGIRRRPSRLRALQEQSQPAPPLSAWLERERAVPYQELLRVIGRALDQRGVRTFELHESATDLVLRLAVDASTDPELHLLSKQDLRTYLDGAIRRRALRTADPLFPPRAATAPLPEVPDRTPAE
jgi:hypothetical protein